VLTNGGSFSNSGIFAAVIQNKKRGKIIGSETGGNAVLLTGGAGYYALPHTQINMLKATHQMAITDPITNIGAGVQPDIEINPELNDILQNNDVVLKKVISLIGEKRIQMHK
jgi:C-terminal processing protease CtpA/Prc